MALFYTDYAQAQCFPGLDAIGMRLIFAGLAGGNAVNK